MVALDAIHCMRIRSKKKKNTCLDAMRLKVFIVHKIWKALGATIMTLSVTRFQW